MSFPLFYLFIPYLVFLGIWLILSLVAFYHMARFGLKRLSTLVLIVIYLIGAIALLNLSYDYLSQVDWQASVSIFAVGPSLPSFDIPSY